MPPLETTGQDLHTGWRMQWRRLAVLRWPDISKLLTETVTNWYDHNVPRLGASVTFYTLLSLAPVLVIVVAIASAVFGREAAEGQLVWQIRDLVGHRAAETVQALLRGAQSPGAGLVASILSIATLVYGATAVVSELRDSLNTIWCVPKRQQTGIRGFLSIVIDRTMAFAAVIGLGVLLLVSLAVNAAISAVGSRYHLQLPAPEFVLRGVELGLTFVVIAVLFALVYKLLPDLPLEWRDVIPGALVTAVLFSAGKIAIEIYLGHATIASTYGAAGSLVVLLLWVYYSAQIFFLGAEFTQAYAQTFGSRPCDRIQKPVEIVSETSRIDHPDEQPPEDPQVQLIAGTDDPPQDTRAPEIEIVISGKDLR